MATAAGFLCFLPTDYKGISELGEIAGVGMLVAFTSSITVLPALLKLLNPPGEKEPVGYAFLAPVDHFLEKHRVVIIVGTLLVAVAGLPLLYFLKFDFNPINLRSPKVESIATFLDLRKDPNTGANAINVMTNSEADAKKIEARLEKVPEVLRVRSLDSFVPEDQPAKLKLIAQGAKVLNPALNPDSIDAAPSDDGECRGLEGIGGEPAQDRRRRQGAGRGGVAAAGRCAVEARRIQSGHARQDAGHLRHAVEGGARPAQELAAGAAGQPEDAAGRSGEFVEDQGRPAARRGAAARRSQRQRDAAQICRRGSGRRAERDRRTGIDSQIRRHRREGLHPCRH